MDMVIGLTEIEYLRLQNNVRDFHVESGHHYHVCKKWMKKTKMDDRIFFQFDKNIRGYGIVWCFDIIDEEMQNLFHGRVWNFIGQRLYTWRKSFWYRIPIEYNKTVEQMKPKYFNLKKVLAGRPEPALIDHHKLIIKENIGGKCGYSGIA